MSSECKLTDPDSSKSPVCGMLGDAGWTWYAGPSHFGKGTHAENEMTCEQGMCLTMLYLNSSSVTHSIPEMSSFTTANILLLISDKSIHSETSRNSSLCLVQPYSVHLQQPDPLPAPSEDFCMCHDMRVQNTSIAQTTWYEGPKHLHRSNNMASGSKTPPVLK